ncbi:MAG: hypothetical protein HC898_10455 [Phycisphaerales bacterium]|nr:hypothetical protein [Phycisphaerales bacterium]
MPEWVSQDPASRALRRQLVISMVGLVLLLAGLCAKLLFDTPYHAQALALLSAIVLGFPLSPKRWSICTGEVKPEA